ncbi:MAG: adenylate/guanylate cyclase domain-containing protein [Candidatus Marinimicrobia bacterium]|jgi:class 3 adenylate cyclase/nitrite reductase/ring-hydroxylating ferredoxin subunit|nr:adenylate/guanylate cyclase domain-containing protein [Candidatus Neomarinimicrobiota bacterium]|tara:strand:+ start:2628 stop:3965 length:1338 start_codon:yes stop_codon:yes gene_type:complete
MPKIDFLPDNKIYESEQGETILRTAARNGIPHVNACGGEGKCTTCRLLILEGIENCSPETETELSLKSKVHTTEEFRLACQTTVTGDIVVRRLVLNKEDIASVSQAGVSGRLGETKKIAILFSDIRGFTPFSEKLTPYDVVFILNRYFNRMVRVVEENHGTVDNYIGDGMVAIFGLNNEEHPVQHAVKSALDMCAEMDDMKPYLKTMYGQDFDIGVGIHWGEAVVGDIGAGRSKRLTAIGDAMNFASRVESANKQFQSRVLISEETHNEIQETLVIKDFMRTNLPGIEGRVTLYEIEDIDFSSDEEKDNERIEEDVLWTKCSEIETFEENKQQVFKIKREDILIVNIDDYFFALNDKCPHAYLSLEGSDIDVQNETIACRWHKSAFCYKTGEVREWMKISNFQKMLGKVGLNAEAQEIAKMEKIPVDVYRTKIQDGFIWVGMESE